MVTHVLPNVLGPVLVIATLQLGFAILARPRSPSSASACRRPSPPSAPHPHRQRLPVLRRVVDHHLPGVALIVLVLSVNLLGDWLRDALNPKLR
jgi:peptide/nickel transport system permease protein